MSDFMILIGQIFIIALIQTIMEAFISPSEKPYQAKVISIACFIGSLYLLIDFIFNNLLNNLTSSINLNFF